VILPLSGYEKEYDEVLWEDFGYYGNCYSYALNAQMQPGTDGIWGSPNLGQLSGDSIDSVEATQTKIKDFVEADEEAIVELGYDYSIEEIDADAKCPANTYKVALFIAPGLGYHWYRQNADGTWSHKLSHNPISNKDSAGNLIWNPIDAQKDYRNLSPQAGLHYTEWVAFFAVTPLDLMYS